MILSNTRSEIRESIKARARHKKLKGELLSPLDKHLLKISKSSFYSFSSLFKTFSSLSILLSKFAILSLSCLYLYGEYLTTEPPEPPLTPINSVSIEEFSSPISESSVVTETLEFKEEILRVKVEGAKIDPHEGLIQFISGVIAVYLPEAVDSGKLAKDIVQVSEEEEIDPLFIASIISVESRFSNKARSNVGAAGLMQLMPSTAKAIAEKVHGRKSQPRLSDTKTNIRLGIHYLKEMLLAYRGDKKLTLAAYNMGPTKLNNILSRRGRIPGSVQNYANEITKKSLLWNKHFQGAKGLGREG